MNGDNVRDIVLISGKVNSMNKSIEMGMKRTWGEIPAWLELKLSIREW